MTVPRRAPRLAAQGCEEPGGQGVLHHRWHGAEPGPGPFGTIGDTS